MSHILEVCVDSVESAIEAGNGGATRLELCGNLIIGGTTPSPKLFEAIKKEIDIETNILIRPRHGDFCYTSYEFNIMLEEVKMFRELGADGIVTGILCSDGTVDVNRMNILIDECNGMNITFHRAFDMCKTPNLEMEKLIELGVDTILTSGQKNNCIDGLSLLKSLIHQSNNRIDIMAGGGITPDNIGLIKNETGITSFHMSGKKLIKGAMEYINPDVNMGVCGVDEYSIYRTDRTLISAARNSN